MISVILITGGFVGGVGPLSSAEVLSEAGAPLCTLPPLPQARVDHTQDGALACGGLGGGIHTYTTCDSFTEQGAWAQSHSLLGRRKDHSSWVSPAGLVLMGGWDHTDGGYTDNTTEIVSSRGDTSIRGFDMAHNTA